MKRQFPGATAYTDRHGKRRWRYRSRGFSAELGGAYGPPEFIARYEEAREARRAPAATRSAPRSISALIEEYYRSPVWKALAEITRRTYRAQIEPFRETHGHRPVAGMRPAHVARILAAKSDTPSAANNLRKRLRQIMGYAVFLEWRPDNPVLATRPYAVNAEGYHTWTERDIAAYLARHEFGTTAHAAMTLMHYTVAARVDVVRLGQGNISGGRIRYRRSKTAKSGGATIDIPLHLELTKTIAARPPGAFTFLETAYGKSRSPAGLGNLMHEWRDDAGLPECSAHGLRKAIARRLAEAGASANEIASVTGHESLSEVSRYTRKAARAWMADSAFEQMIGSAARVANLPEGSSN